MDITVRLPEALVERAKSSGLAPNVFVERLLSKIAEISLQNSARAQLRNELAADWEHFQTTGLHLNDDDVDLWLAGLESGQSSDLPELHP
jgi:hypothetical protein